MDVISVKQQRVLEYISRFIDNNGIPPTVRDIGEGLGLSSPATVNYHLKILTQAGYIAMAPKKTRSITLLRLPEQEAPPIDRVPLLGDVAAGAPILAEERVEEYLHFDTQGRQEEYFALRVRGDSMVEAGILEGDCVVVHRQEEARNGDIVVAVFQDEATVKTLQIGEKGTWLLPANREYEPIDGTYATIQGKVVGVIRHY